MHFVGFLPIQSFLYFDFRAYNGAEITLKFGINLERNAQRPVNRNNCFNIFWVGKFITLSFLSGLMLNFPLVIVCPK